MSRFFFNRIILIGYMENVFLKTTKLGKEMGIINLLTNVIQKDSNTGDISNSLEHHTVNVYNPKIIEQIKDLKKGTMIFVMGEMQNSDWTDSNGNIHKANQVVVTGYRGEVYGMNNIISENDKDQHNFFSFNKVFLSGNVGNISIKSTKFGKEIATFSLATNSFTKDQVTGEQKQITEWHNIVIYNPKLVEMAKNIKTGDNIFLSGEKRNSEWYDENSNLQRRVKINVSEIKIIQRKGESDILGQNIFNDDDDIFTPTISSKKNVSSKNSFNDNAFEDISGDDEDTPF